MAKKQATVDITKKGIETPNSKIETETLEMKEKTSKVEQVKVSYDILRESVGTKTAALYQEIIILQREAKSKGLPFASRYTNFYKAIEQNCKKLKIKLPAKSDIV